MTTAIYFAKNIVGFLFVAAAFLALQDFHPWKAIFLLFVAGGMFMWAILGRETL